MAAAMVVGACAVSAGVRGALIPEQRQWSRAMMRSMMKTHLDQGLSEGVDQLTGHYAASVRQYDAIEKHILTMADMLSNGIAQQFPHRFN